MDEQNYIGRWINPFRVIPYIVFWGIWALLALSLLTLMFDSIDSTPDMFIITVATAIGLALVAFFPAFNKYVDKKFSKKS